MGSWGEDENPENIIRYREFWDLRLRRWAPSRAFAPQAGSRARAGRPQTASRTTAEREHVRRGRGRAAHRIVVASGQCRRSGTFSLLPEARDGGHDRRRRRA
eukprot:2639096-Pyramimonas_sp.AAC.1